MVRIGERTDVTWWFLKFDGSSCVSSSLLLTQEMAIPAELPIGSCVFFTGTLWYLGDK